VNSQNDTQNDTWVWISRPAIIAIHSEQLSEHGGIPGIRDENLLDSALARPQQKAAYDDDADLAALAAAYGYGIARNHPFLDGNKRTALVATELFLALNGYDLLTDDTDCLTTFLLLAEGSLPENELAKWLRRHLSPMG